MIKSWMLLLLLNISAASSIYGQEKDIQKPETPVFLRFNVLGILDPFDNNFCLGIEKKFKPRLAVAFDAGWIFHSAYLSQSKSVSGIILRPAIRFYPREAGRGFMEFEVHYKDVLYKIEDWVGRKCVKEVPAYDEFTTFRYRKKSYGFHLRGGVKGALDHEKRFWIEMSGGLGLRWKRQGIYREPGSCYNRSGSLFDLGNELFVSSVAPLTLRMLYRL